MSRDDSSDDCPWKSDESEEQHAPGKKSKVFTVDYEVYSYLEAMRGKLLEFTTEINRVVKTAGWSASAVHNAIDAIYGYIDGKYEEYQGYLLSGLVERNGTMEIELLLSKEFCEVSY